MTSGHPDEAERRARLRLARTDRIGPVTFRELMARCGSAAAALDALPDLARRAGRAPTLPTLEAIDAEIAAGEALGARLIVWGDPDYPPALAACDPPSPILWIRGDPALLSREAVAIVGARIAAEGCLVSESPVGARAQARDFPRRNRVIAGLSRGVIVVEAELKSGSLITARLAGEMGREVFAVPGSPLDPRSKGTNDLIRQGAILCEDDDDVLTAFAGLRTLAEPPADRWDAAHEPADAALIERVADLLSPVPTPRDELARAAGASAAAVAAALLELSLAGRAVLLPGGLAASGEH